MILGVCVCVCFISGSLKVLAHNIAVSCRYVGVIYSADASHPGTFLQRLTSAAKTQNSISSTKKSNVWPRTRRNGDRVRVPPCSCMLDPPVEHHGQAYLKSVAVHLCGFFSAKFRLLTFAMSLLATAFCSFEKVNFGYLVGTNMGEWSSRLL